MLIHGPKRRSQCIFQVSKGRLSLYVLLPMSFFSLCMSAHFQGKHPHLRTANLERTGRQAELLEYPEPFFQTELFQQRMACRGLAQLPARTAACFVLVTLVKTTSVKKRGAAQGSTQRGSRSQCLKMGPPRGLSDAQVVSSAYEILSDDPKRAEYDRKLRLTGATFGSRGGGRFNLTSIAFLKSGPQLGALGEFRSLERALGRAREIERRRPGRFPRAGGRPV